jgi:transcriptional antiterminator NusG
MYSWYAVKATPGREIRAKRDIEHRLATLGLSDQVRRVVVPSETVIVEKNGQKREAEKRTMPGYVLIHMRVTDDSWGAIKSTPGVGGFVGGEGKPVPLTMEEVERLMGRQATSRVQKSRFEVGQMITVRQGHALAGFTGTVSEVNEEQRKLRLMIEIFEREVPTELSFDQVETPN